jgi:putative dimethyl sulfoxide reductase chaperone
MTLTTIPAEILGTPHVQQLLARSALYEALALALAYPDEEALTRLDALIADLSNHALAESRGLGQALRRLQAARAEVEADRLAPVHFVLFEGSVLCSPHETEYVRDPFAKAAQLADIAGFYSAFGLKVSNTHHSTPDEIGAELEFMAMLTRKEAFAALQGWDDRAGIARDAGRKFLEGHLGRWTGAFASDLCAQADTAAGMREDPPTGAWYHAVGDLLRSAMDADMSALGVYPSLLHTRVVDPESDTLLECPMATEPQLIRDEDIPVDGGLGRPNAPPDSMRAN